MRNKESPLISAPKTQLNLIAFFSYFYLFEKLLRVSRGREKIILSGMFGRAHHYLHSNDKKNHLYLSSKLRDIILETHIN